MKSKPCAVCGCTELNLVDGYYYCVECGTQDVEVRETVIEDKVFDDGTFATKVRNKITKIIQREGPTVSGEWHKWHAYNYMMVGLIEEMLVNGAPPSFKTNVLWLWTMYVKKFQRKKELGLPMNNDEDDEIEDVSCVNRYMLCGKKPARDRRAYDVSRASNLLFFTIVYLGLNFARSEIQLTNLIRFVKEGRLTLRCTKFIPKEIDTSQIEDYNCFCSTVLPSIEFSRIYAMTFLKTFNLGSPVIPDITNLTERYIKELCLPNEFKSLVFSLMHMIPYDHLELDDMIMKKMIRIPLYEIIPMSYILVALKMCFGLDDCYENKLSDAVDKINNENCYMKSYKLGEFSIASDRLFSFREWCNFLQLRKILLCKYYMPIAKMHNVSVDDYVYMEQRDPPILYKAKPSLSEQVTMDILNRIELTKEIQAIPKSAFPPTLTPLTTYTQVILEYYKDPELKLLFSEDFSQYSLKYACENLNLQLSENTENIVVGVDDNNKCINHNITGRVAVNEYDSTKVYVRNFESKHWLKTNPPTTEHIVKAVESEIDEKNDLCYDEAAENKSDLRINNDSMLKTSKDHNTEIEEKLEFIDEEKEGKNIFDDDFQDLEENQEEKYDITNECIVKLEPVDNFVDSFNEDLLNNKSLLNNESERIENVIGNEDDGISHSIDDFFNPDTFDREATIKELVILACKKHKIPIPAEYNPKKPRKRKPQFINEEADSSEIKKRKIANRGETKAVIDELLSKYYESVNEDVSSARTEVEESHHDHINENLIALNEPSDENLSALNEPNDESQFGNEDPSVIELANDTINESLSQTEEDIYDTKQLFLKLKDGSDFNDLFRLESDPELERIIDKKIDEFVNKKNETITKNHKIVDASCDEDEIPLSKIREANLVQDNPKAKLKHLIKNRKEITKYNYWAKHYVSKYMRKSYDMNEKFNLELRENFPKSFAFVIEECAAILDCSPFLLYKAMVNIEEVLFTKI